MINSTTSQEMSSQKTLRNKSSQSIILYCFKHKITASYKNYRKYLISKLTILKKVTAMLSE